MINRKFQRLTRQFDALMDESDALMAQYLREPDDSLASQVIYDKIIRLNTAMDVALAGMKAVLTETR